MSDPRAGHLVLVTTPIGNARDITLRALDLLREATVLVAEDTRSLRRLMDIHGVAVGGRPLLAYHDHSGPRMRDKVLDHLGAGALVVYASEAGTPLIADPGYDLVQVARAAGYGVTAAPGPSAAVTALSLAGLPTDRFFFEGFLPSAKGGRRKVLQSLTAVPGTLIFYESPKRLEKSLSDMAEILGPARAGVIARELTKRFEEIRSAPLGDLVQLVAESPPKGEIVVLVGPAAAAEISPEDITEMLTEALASQSAKDAVAQVSAATGAPRRQVYKEALAILGKS
ncbi:16S rRNA (cytidine(1402)-2'-O)-methyltransferase [Dinoroseobacter sp. S124A]|uniref:16S rRNA (cytidine(1402)-2'-O)-methyltransferase n=1 Tax=Dinoroseobacter sp. S124A TaxID=3415128 RepID=UPI003C7CDA50